MHVQQQLYNFIDFEPLDAERKSAIDKLLIGTQLNDISAFRNLYDFGRS
jgi:hypothetical protein